MTSTPAPITAEEFFDRGHQLMQASDFGEALYHFSEAIRLRPDVAAGYRYRAYVHSELGKRLQAIADFDEAIRLRPDDLQVYADRAMELFLQHAYDSCVADCNTVLGRDPGRGAVYGLRARALAAMGDSLQAEHDFTRALEADPEEAASYHHGRGELFAEREEFDAALSDFTTSLTISPDQPHVLISRGAILFTMGQIDAAAADLDVALTLKPDAVNGFCVRARIRIDQQQFADALADLDTALRLRPGMLAAIDLRADCRVRLGQYEAALTDYDELIRRQPNSLRAYNGRAACHYQMCAYAKAIRDSMEALRINPQHAATFNYLAWIWSTAPDAEIRNGQRAYECATRACELTEWQNAEMLDTLAAALAELGRCDEAIQWQRKAIERSDTPRCETITKSGSRYTRRINHYG